MGRVKDKNSSETIRNNKFQLLNEFQVLCPLSKRKNEIVTLYTLLNSTDFFFTSGFHSEKMEKHLELSDGQGSILNKKCVEAM